MNPRLPYSARQLQNEISEIDEDATFEGAGLDGLGTYRAMVVETPHAREIGRAILQVAAIDRRIASVDAEENVLTITFPPDRIVESHARFGLRDIYNALYYEAAADKFEEALPQSTEPPEELIEKIEQARKEPEKTKPRPRKRAAKKS